MQRKNVFISVGIVVVLIVVAFFVNRQLNKVSYDLAVVQIGNITQEVLASGKVETSTKIDLHFKNSGKLTLLNASIGDKVPRGKLLARQDTSQFDAQIGEMQAGIDLQKAKLAQLLAGASAEDLAIAETVLSNAEIFVANSKQALENAKQNILNVIKDSYTKSDDAIRNKIDKFFSNPRSANPSLSFTIADAELEAQIEFERYVVETKLQEWNTSLFSLTSDSDPKLFYEQALSNVNTIKNFLEKIAFAINALSPSSSLSQVTVDSYKVDTSTARTNISTALTNLLNAQENLNTKQASVNTAKGNLKTAQEQLSLKKAPVRDSDSAAFEAQIRQAESSLEKVAAQRDELIIYAPSSGSVVKTNGEVGEVVNTNTAIVSLASVDSLQIRLNIAEENIANVKAGQEARVTLDAVEGQSFVGRVASVEPTETVIGGAVYYQAIIVCNEKNGLARSGMTANVWIKTGYSEETLLVPASAILKDGDKRFVQVSEDGLIMEKEVVVGLRDSSGVIEIISGLSAGEQVVIGSNK